MIVGISIALVFVLIIIGVPIAFALGSAGILLALYAGIPVISLAQNIFASVDVFAYLALPMFFLAGTFMEYGGISRRLIKFSNALVGHFYGGLGMICALAGMFMGAISGSGVAATAALGGITIPEMARKGYSKGFAATIMASAGSLGVIIPPSLPMIILSTLIGVSVAELFVAGILPGIMIGIVLMLVSFVYAKVAGIPREKKTTLKEGMDAFKGSMVALIAPLIIFFGVAGGVFTITESAGIMALYCFLVGKFYYKEFTMKEIPQMLMSTVSVAASVLMVIAFSSILSWFIVAYDVPANLSAAMPAGMNKIIFLITINIMFLILGTFIDMIPNLVITMPVLFPLAMAFGIDPVHFGIIAIVNLAIGLVTPPVGTCLFVASGIANVNQKETYKYALPVCGLMIICLLIVTFVPSVSLFLVSFIR